MKIDVYTKIIFALIAIALWGLLLQPFFASKQVVASTGIIDVNIKQIEGRNINSALDVNIKKINGRTIYGSDLPVEVKK